ncbi:DUF1810 domain-containing protein [Sphingobium nicotianae]|uniref:DUF1810 family protein n=1 Tax=Sphingobium nicotianae TaxID=2782607 RepID=A0A9X1DCW6_9SPHN|nr:DUF1810 domain-containing protein [Sphingobium nicotianae]MBT2187840.1 DUF1810 family protein [Sphingobium nicotianae]
MSDDPFDLQRFVKAQDQIYPRALAEIRAGAKRSHWMWFIFPQHVALGRSPMAVRYGISSIEEARAYLAHPLLAPRLRECVAALAKPADPDPVRVFGDVDAAKLRSCLTLFEAADGGAAFGEALVRWYGGVRDEATLRLLATPLP